MDHRSAQAPPLPVSIKPFRHVINKFKHNILENKLIDQGKQDIQYFNEAGSRIQQFGNILKQLVEGKIQCDTNPTATNICTIFNENGIDFSNITDEERSLYLYYIKNDTYDAAYSLLPKKSS